MFVITSFSCYIIFDVSVATFILSYFILFYFVFFLELEDFCWQQRLEYFFSLDHLRVKIFKLSIIAVSVHFFHFAFFFLCFPISFLRFPFCDFRYCEYELTFIHYFLIHLFSVLFAEMYGWMSSHAHRRRSN